MSLNKHQVILVVIGIFPSTVIGAPFVDFGIGAVDGCIMQSWHAVNNKVDIECSSGALGYIAAGYEHKGFSIQAEHWSSLIEKDRGLNLISVKYRFTIGND